MALNFWQCDHPGCTVTATGAGGAFGLLAIGWWFLLGSKLFCPAHRPDPVPCRDDGDNRGKPCSTCAGDAEADMIQHAIVHHSEDIRAWYAAHLLAESKER